MGKYRAISKNNPYYLPKELHLSCIHYALNYRDWKAYLEVERDTRGAIRYDKDRIQTANDYDSTSETAMKMVEIAEKVAKIDSCIDCACDDEVMRKWLRLGVCHGYSIYQLMDGGMPCGKNYFSRMRQRFYYELSKKI